MKRARCQKFFIGGIISACLFLGAYSIRRSTLYLLKSAPITICHDEIVHEEYRTQFANYIIDRVKTNGPAVAVHNYSEQFPILSAITIRYTVPLHATVSYDVILPDACLNDFIGLLPNGKTVSADIFTAELLATVPHLEVPIFVFSLPELPVALKNCSKKLSHDLLERFSCAWQNDYTCYYHDDKNIPYTLVYEGHTPPTSEDIALYDQIIMQHKPDRKRTQWLVDLRFKNQVVVSPNEGI